MPKKPVKVYLTTPQRETLAKIAKAEETSKSEVLRGAFRRYAIKWILADKKPKVKERVSWT